MLSNKYITFFEHNSLYKNGGSLENYIKLIHQNRQNAIAINAGFGVDQSSNPIIITTTSVRLKCYHHILFLISLDTS